MTVEQLIETNPDATIEDKNQLIEEWTESFYARNGKLPSSLELSKLADWLLADTLKDVSRSKVQKEEFPILSRPQIERRYREISLESDIVDVIRLKRRSNQPTKKRDSKNNEY